MLYRITYKDTGDLEVQPINFAKEIDGEIAIISEVGYKKIGHKCDYLISTIIQQTSFFRGVKCTIPKLKGVYVYTKGEDSVELWKQMMREEFEATQAELKESFTRMVI